MEPTSLSKRSTSHGLALGVASIVNAVLVVAKECSHPVMDAMKKATGHHWTTHALVVLAVFVSSAWVFGRMKGGQGSAITFTRLVTFLVGCVLLASAIIIGFNLLAD